jgi:hypothetical protein
MLVINKFECLLYVYQQQVILYLMIFMKQYGILIRKSTLTLFLLIICSAAYTANPHRGQPCPLGALNPVVGLVSGLNEKEMMNQYIYIYMCVCVCVCVCLKN